MSEPLAFLADEGAAKSPRADLGVLFVHGIGQQYRGETLTEFGGPLLRWIRRWIGREDSVRVLDASLVELPENPSAPPFAMAEIHASDSEKPSRWLIAESWWADTFAVPSFHHLWQWTVRVAPWVIATHFAGGVAFFLREYNRADREATPSAAAGDAASKAPAKRRTTPRQLLLAVPLTAVLLVYWVFVSAATALVAVTLVALALVAIPPFLPLRKAVTKVQQVLAATVGDSYVLLGSPIIAGAIEGRVSRDLAWLADRCEAVAVVAHSQGGAIAHETLRRAVPETMKRRGLLITFGSGLKKLEGIRRGEGKGLLVVGWYLVFFAVAFAASVFFGAGGGWVIYAWLPLTLGTGALVVVLRGPGFRHADFDPQARFGVALPWQDYYASADPVPAGPLFERDQPAPFLDPAAGEVFNRASMLEDHNRYWDNPEEFIAGVAFALGKLCGIDFTAADAATSAVPAAQRRRGFRVKWLGRARVSLLLLAPLLLVSLFRSWGSVALLASRLSPWLARLLPASWVAYGERSGFLSVGVVCLAVYLAYRLLYFVWARWEGHDVARFFARQGPEEVNLFRVVFFVLWLVFLALGVTIAFA